MNLLPISRSGSAFGRKSGFTLVEMMAAIAVLSMIVVMLGQVMAMVSQAWMNGQRHVNNFTKARVMLDMFSSDIESGVFRSDLLHGTSGSR